MADLRAKLRSILAHTKDNAERNFDSGLCDLGDELRNICRNDKAEETLLELLLESAKTLDAIEYIESHWQKEETKNFKVSKHANVEETRSYFREIFDSGKASNRGCVYVAWRQSKLDFHYVGMTIGPSRIIHQHIKLAHSLSKASTLSFIYPHKSTTPCLRRLEASLIKVLLFTGLLPQNNEQLPEVPFGKGSQELREVTIELERRTNEIFKNLGNKFRGSHQKTP